MCKVGITTFASYDLDTRPASHFDVSCTITTLLYDRNELNSEDTLVVLSAKH